jgi:hypothetical protein
MTAFVGASECGKMAISNLIARAILKDVFVSGRKLKYE